MQGEAFKYIISSPKPEYPYEAREQRLSGAGVAIVRIDRATGTVVRVVMYISTRQPILDRSTVEALSRWKFRPGTPFKAVEIPITYTIDGGAYGVGFVTKESNMDDVLARYLGKGTVISAPIPQYPTSKTWDFKEGRGVYELHVTKFGTVSGVRILKRSGDETFDRLAT
ncbi:MAG: TonB family protein, partial [Chthoniobacterales bacterium]